MSCCGQRRLEARAPTPPRQDRPPAPPVLDAPTPVRYLGATPVVVRGPKTGNRYTFGRHGETLTVDGRDVASLVRLGLFER